MSRQRYDNESLPGGGLDKQYKKGPKDTFIPGNSITPVPFVWHPKPKLGKEPPSPQPKRR